MWKFSVLWIFGILHILSVYIGGILSLKDVLLTIEPDIVQRLSHSTLQCSYDLEGDPLYSVKWYRGNFEFYRYTPSEHPNTKIFPISGLNVDINNSNSTQVTLRDIDFPLSGKFSCEVTTDTPFSTGTDTQAMLVVKLPEYPPTISVGREPLDYGDTLRANCSSSPSRPRASLTFLLNNLSVARSEPLSAYEAQRVSWSDLTLEMKLSEFHFSSGRLTLQCIAEIPDLYREVAVLKLVSARDPVPARVRAVNKAGHISSKTAAQVVLLVYISVLLS